MSGARSMPWTLIINIALFGSSISCKTCVGHMEPRCKVRGPFAAGAVVSTFTNKGSLSGYSGRANQVTTASSVAESELQHWYRTKRSIFRTKTYIIGDDDLICSYSRHAPCTHTHAWPCTHTCTMHTRTMHTCTHMHHGTRNDKQTW